MSALHPTRRNLKSTVKIVVLNFSRGQDGYFLCVRFRIDTIKLATAMMIINFLVCTHKASPPCKTQDGEPMAALLAACCMAIFQEALNSLLR